MPPPFPTTGEGLLRLQDNTNLCLSTFLSLSDSVCVCWCVNLRESRARACVLAKAWIIEEQRREWKHCRTGQSVWDCAEMGERNTLKQQEQPGYDGLCNYAQKITSCFGLDGKTECEKYGEDGCGGRCFVLDCDIKRALWESLFAVCWSSSWIFIDVLCGSLRLWVIVVGLQQSGLQLEGNV